MSIQDTSESTWATESRVPRLIGAWRRLALSAMLAMLPLLGQLIAMPGVDFALGTRDAGASETTSVVALGVSPLVSAYLMVEVAALVVPRWRRLRHGMPDGRRRLNRAVVTFALILAAFQALGVAMTLEASQIANEVDRAVVIVTLVGATSVMVLLAAQIERLGVANGMVALLLVESVSGLVQRLPQVVVPSGALPLLALASCLVLPVLATWSAVRAFEPPSGVDATTGRLAFSLPTSSLQPAAAAAALMAMPAALQKLHLPFDDELVPLLELAESPSELPARLGIAVVLTLLFTLLLQRPLAVRRTLAALDLGRAAPTTSAVLRSLALELVPTVAFTVLLVCCDDVAARGGLPTPLAPVLVIATAMVLDGRRAVQLYRAAPDLVCITEERRPYALPALLAAAARGGVLLQATGVATTGLLRVFGPYSGARLLCRSSEADKARQVLAALFDREAAEPVVATAPAATLPARKADWNRGAGLSTMFGALVALLVVWIRLGGFPPFCRQVGETTLRDNVDASFVDDEADPFKNIKALGLPAGVAILHNSVLVRSGGRSMVQRSFIRLVPQDGETLDEARQRIAPWLAGTTLPDGRRLAWGELRDEESEPINFDQDDRIADRVNGFRSYLLEDDPILTTSELSRATLAQNADRNYLVGLRLRPEFAERFRVATASEQHGRLAISVNGIVRIAPTLVSEIAGGYLEITMGGGVEPELTKHRAERLYLQLQRH